MILFEIRSQFFATKHFYFVTVLYPIPFLYFQANRNNLDGYLLYLEGVVLKKLDLRSQAVTVLQASVAAAPTLWAAWVELSGLANEYEALDALQLPEHWMMYFFAAHAFVELKLSDQALDAYLALAAVGFHKSTYVTAQMAIAHHDRRGRVFIIN